MSHHHFKYLQYVVVTLLTHDCMLRNEAFVLHYLFCKACERARQWVSSGVRIVFSRCRVAWGGWGMETGFPVMPQTLDFRAPAGTFWPWHASVVLLINDY